MSIELLKTALSQAVTGLVHIISEKNIACAQQTADQKAVWIYIHAAERPVHCCIASEVCGLLYRAQKKSCSLSSLWRSYSKLVRSISDNKFGGAELTVDEEKIWIQASSAISILLAPPICHLFTATTPGVFCMVHVIAQKHPFAFCTLDVLFPIPVSK